LFCHPFAPIFIKDNNDLFIFDLNDKIWRKPDVTGSKPDPRFSMGFTAASNGMLYVFGGFSNELSDCLNDLYSFNPNTNTWTLASSSADISPPPSPRQSMGFAALGNTLYVFGGHNFGKCLRG
jgi:N-acetylneuraminic acid mutarotase